MLYASFQTLEKGQFLFQPGDATNKFYFVVSGQIEIIFKKEGDEDFKHVKSIE